MQTLTPVETAVHPPVAGAAAPVLPALRWDPRLYQIATLSGLLGYGVFWLDLEVQTRTAVAIIVMALVTQLVCTRLTGRGRFDPRSALISALSLCLLLRTGSLGLAMLTAAVAIASKFTLRVRDKHVFNPTNFALVAMMLATGRVWVSPGQWGSGLVFAFLLASAGGLVVNRAARADITLVAALLVVALAAPTVLAFCGFYVARADAKLFNQASQVVLVRHDDKTVLTMANDFKGDLKEFAIVVPVPTVLEKGQVRVSDRALIEHLDAYSAPRLVEYFDNDPCSPRYPAALQAPTGMATARHDMALDRANSLGVTIEARY